MISYKKLKSRQQVYNSYTISCSEQVLMFALFENSNPQMSTFQELTSVHSLYSTGQAKMTNMHSIHFLSLTTLHSVLCQPIFDQFEDCMEHYGNWKDYKSRTTDCWLRGKALNRHTFQCIPLHSR